MSKPVHKTPLDHLPIRVVALYHFVEIAHPQDLATTLEVICRQQGIRGTLLLAHEGINGTVAGTPEAIAVLSDALDEMISGPRMEIKYSAAAEMPFRRLKVKVKPEIVTMGVEDINPSIHAGTYVDAHDWNDLISDPDTIVIDTRNDYEVAIGSFSGAINPNTTSFSEFPKWLEDQKQIWEAKGRKPKLAMFCTGGIRCEKSTAFAKRIGLDEVFHLKGGILRYLEDIPPEQSRWEGDCFVFDERVAVGHGLSLTDYQLCHACRVPLSAEDRQHPAYVPGISCSHCLDSLTEDKRRRFAERQKQIALAKARGVEHLGDAYSTGQIKVKTPSTSKEK
ncbi:MAG: rhodanese-related sulfurtransferase [Alphaproteobacteria bacterium]|nr:rhodanese-related sulfurtransferase [Alphaproteobacteria bacterium]